MGTNTERLQMNMSQAVVNIKTHLEAVNYLTRYADDSVSILSKIPVA